MSEANPNKAQHHSAVRSKNAGIRCAHSSLHPSRLTPPPSHFQKFGEILREVDNETLDVMDNPPS